MFKAVLRKLITHTLYKSTFKGENAWKIVLESVTVGICGRLKCFFRLFWTERRVVKSLKQTSFCSPGAERLRRPGGKSLRETEEQSDKGRRGGYFWWKERFLILAWAKKAVCSGMGPFMDLKNTHGNITSRSMNLLYKCSVKTRV